MNIALRKPMNREAFFAWAEAQEGRYEFDGVQPVAMTGGNLDHSCLIGNINRHLGNRLAGRPCRPMGPDAGVATIGDTVRYPDAVVTCSSFNGKSHLVPNPVIVFEVVSPTTVRMDHVIKLREYQAVPTIRRYLIVESNAAVITLHARDQDGVPFDAGKLVDSDRIMLPEIGIELPVAAIYEGTDFGQGSTP